jgi:integrase
MATKNFTAKSNQDIEQLPITGARYEVRTNTPGLRLRVSVKGEKRFLWTYTSPTRTKGGKPVRVILDLGLYSDKNKLGVAADKLDEAKQMVLEGLDPQDSEVDTADPEQAVLMGKPVTVADLCDKFYAQRIVTMRDRPEVVKQILDSVIKPTIGAVKMNRLTQDHLLLPAQQVAARGSEAHARNTFRLTLQMMDWAKARKQLHGDNPLTGLSLANAGLPDNSQPRDRVLTDDEIRTFYGTLNRYPTCIVKASALKLLILLGCRTRELRLNTWANVDLDSGVMTVPVELLKTRKKTKGIKALRVPLPAAAVQILRNLKPVTGSTGFICGMPATGQPLIESALRGLVDRVLRKTTLTAFTPHDLRRTYRTRLTQLGVSFEVAETAIGHALPKIVRTYVVTDLFDERAKANDLLAAQLELLMELRPKLKMVG